MTSDCRLHHPLDEAHPAWSRPRYLLQAPGGGARAQGPVRPRGFCSRLHPELRERHARRRPGDQGPPQVHGRMSHPPRTRRTPSDNTPSSTASPSTLLPSSSSRLPTVPVASTTAFAAAATKRFLTLFAWRYGELLAKEGWLRMSRDTNTMPSPQTRCR